MDDETCTRHCCSQAPCVRNLHCQSSPHLERESAMRQTTVLCKPQDLLRIQRRPRATSDSVCWTTSVLSLPTEVKLEANESEATADPRRQPWEKP